MDQNRRSKAEITSFVAMFAIASIFAAMAAWSAFHPGAAGQASIAKSELKVSAAEVIGPLSGVTGSPTGRYTLVEFGDYQCPPCHQAAAVVPAVLRQYRVKLRFAFRNLPLTSIHPFAMRAALIAESARRAGGFWAVHDALYRVDAEQFYGPALDKIVHTYKVTIDPRAMTAVNADVKDAGRIGIKGTPTFLLCTPTGRAYRVSNLDQIDYYIQMK